MKANFKLFMRMGRAFAEAWFRFWDHMDDLIDLVADVCDAGLERIRDGIDAMTDAIAQAGLAVGALSVGLARAARKLVRLRIDKPDAPR